MKKIVYTMVALLTLAACNKQQTEPEGGATTAHFIDAAIATKAVDNKWQENDRIGIFMIPTGAEIATATAKNIEHKVAAAGATGTFAAVDVAQQIMFPADGSKVNFYAYYPYQAEPSKVYNLADQSNPAKIDMMCASINEQDKANPKVALQFKHQLSKLSLTIQTGGGLTAAHLVGMTAKVMGTPGSYSFTPESRPTLNHGTVADIDAMVSGNLISAILCPDNYPNGKVVFTLPALGGKTFEWKWNRTLNIGENLAYTITLNRTSITVSSPNIMGWNEMAGGSGTANKPFIEYANIPAGTFIMGSPITEPNRDDYETQHQVTLTKNFKMSKYEITAAQYAVFLNAVGVPKADVKAEAIHNVDGHGNQPLFNVNEWGWTPKWNDATSKWETTNNSPMINVSWYGAKAFADWVGGELPTEAQWEYACRAGTTTMYSFGADATNIGDYCVYSGNKEGDGPSEVGGKLPNAWGLYDMHGNVWEWCADSWDGTTPYSADAITDPVSPNPGSYRVLRGGYWDRNAQYCRSAVRTRIDPKTCASFGFRVVITEK